MIYLASPYTGSPHEMNERFEYVTLIAAQLFNAGFLIYSPITHGHPMTGLVPELGSVDRYAQWMEHGLCLLKKCTALYILDTPGWNKSKGVQEECECAFENNIPVSLLTINHEKTINSRYILTQLVDFDEFKVKSYMA